MMRIAEDYHIISSLTAGEYLQSTIKAATQADDEEVVRRRAATTKLEAELDELKTCVCVSFRALNAQGGMAAVPATMLCRVCVTVHCVFLMAPACVSLAGTGTSAYRWLSCTRPFRKRVSPMATASAS